MMAWWGPRMNVVTSTIGRLEPKPKAPLTKQPNPWANATTIIAPSEKLSNGTGIVFNQSNILTKFKRTHAFLN